LAEGPLRAIRLRRSALLACLGLAACSGVQVHTQTAPGARLPARLVAVYPFGLRWKAPAYRAYELGMDEVAAVLADGRLSALGPSEFHVLDFESDALFAATDLSAALPAWRVAPEAVLGLRGWAERRETSGSRVLYDQAGHPVGRKRTAEVEIVVHEELLGAPAGTLAEAWAVVPVDPFADHPTYDPDPELRRWAGKLTRAVLAAAASRLAVADPPEDPGFDAELNPRDEDDFALPGRASLAELLARADPVDREAAHLDRLLYFSPDLPGARTELFDGLPQGLYVTRVRSEAARQAGLQEGDFVARVDGAPAAGLQTVLRELALRPAGTSIELAVLRGPTHETLRLPVPGR